MRNIHNFKDQADFRNWYNDTGSTVVTAVTASAGTFTYDRYETEDLDPWEGYPSYIWVKDGVEWGTERRNPRVGDWIYRPIIEGGEIVDWEELQITAVSAESVPGTYLEPWVSKTHSTKISVDGRLFEYVGEFDVYQGEFS